jgi:hypothetical protein
MPRPELLRISGASGGPSKAATLSRTNRSPGINTIAVVIPGARARNLSARAARLGACSGMNRLNRPTRSTYCLQAALPS